MVLSLLLSLVLNDFQSTSLKLWLRFVVAFFCGISILVVIA